MAMDRETLQKQKERSQERLEKRRAAVPFEQLDAEKAQSQLMAELLEVQRQSLASLNVIKVWVTIFGLVLILNLILAVIALAQ